MIDSTGNLYSCPLAYAISQFEGKWKPFIVWHISIAPGGSIRYGSLMRALPFTISHKMFTQHLRELEADGIINRQVFQEVPAHVEYSLTTKGETLATIFYLLRDWGSVYGGFSSEVLERSQSETVDGAAVYKCPESPTDDFSDLDRLGMGSMDIMWNCDLSALSKVRGAQEEEEAELSIA